MKLSAQQKVFLASAVAHGLLIVILSPWLTLVSGEGTPRVAELRSDIVAASELNARPPVAPDLLPVPPEDLPPAKLTDTAPPEEKRLETPLFEPLAQTPPSTRFAIPRELSIVVRSAHRSIRKPDPEVALAPPAVRAIAVSAPTRRSAGLSRKAMPANGNLLPRYPARAVERALEGVVLVGVHLDREGQVARVELLRGSGYSILDREALRAVGAWSFRPALKDGIAIPSRIEVPIRFRIS